MYVLICQWGPEARVDLSEYWLVTVTYMEFKEMYQKLRKCLNPHIPLGASNPSFPKLVSLDLVSVRAYAATIPLRMLLPNNSHE